MGINIAGQRFGRLTAVVNTNIGSRIGAKRPRRNNPYIRERLALTIDASKDKFFPYLSGIKE